MWSARAWALGLGWGLFAVGCGHKSAPHAPGDDVDAQIDWDAAVDADGGEEDAGEEDAGLDAADPLPDGGDISECAGDLFSFVAARAPGRPLSAQIVGNRTHLVFVVPSAGGSSSNNIAQGLSYVSFDTTEPAPDPMDLVNVGIDRYDRTRDPSLVAHGTDLHLFYTAAVSGDPFELFSMDPTSADPPVQRTQNGAVIELGNAAGTFGADVAVAYSDDSPDGTLPSAIQLAIEGKDTHELVAESEGLHAVQLAFAEQGSSGARGGLLGFVSDLNPGIYAQAVDENGDPRGELLTLTDKIGASSNVAVARGHDDSGAIVYTESLSGNVHQLRFREIDAEGIVSETPRNLTSANQNLRDIAIAAYSHGFVIAYRRLGGVPSAPASVYLLFVDEQGNVAGSRLVHASAATGGGLSVLVANDGRLVVLWADNETVTDTDTNKVEVELRVRVARLTCAL